MKKGGSHVKKRQNFEQKDRREVKGYRKGNERYRSASKTFREWLGQSVLIQDDELCIYPYYQEFEFEGEKYERKG